MRVLDTDKKLLRILASEIAEKKKPIRLVAQEQNTALDEATESAKAYWMMGWTWEEIDSILEDSGFPANAIASAIKKAQEYAYECLKDGPFNTLKEGQLIKLNNGMVGKLLNKYAEHISISEGNDKLEVSASNVDFETSTKLQKAYILRENAKKLMKEAQGDKIIVPGETSMGDYPKELKNEPVIRETKPQTRVTPEMQVPKQVKKYLPEKFLDVPEATVTIQEYADTLGTLREMLNELEEEKAKMYAIYKEQFLGPEAELKKETQEIGQKLAAIMESQRQAANVLETVFINRTQELLVGFVSEIQKEKKYDTPGFVDQYNALVEFLEQKFPEVAKEALAMIEGWQEDNSVTYRELTTNVFVAKPPIKMVERKHAQGMWSKMTKWVSDLWNSVKQTTNNFYSKTVPEIEEINSALEDFLDDTQLQEQTASINKSLKIYMK